MAARWATGAPIKALALTSAMARRRVRKVILADLWRVYQLKLLAGAAEMESVRSGSAVGPQPRTFPTTLEGEGSRP